MPERPSIPASGSASPMDGSGERLTRHSLCMTPSPLFHLHLVRREQPRISLQSLHTPKYTRPRKPSCLRHHREACYHRAYRASSQFRGHKNAFRTFSHTEHDVRYSPLPTIDFELTHRGASPVNIHTENIGIFAMRMNPILDSNHKTRTPCSPFEAGAPTTTRHRNTEPSYAFE
jgi:hypothetical protein